LCNSWARYQGACYYDAGAHGWAILTPNGRCLPRHTSPIAERDTFAIFDDARCRGADLQLRPQAVGLLTLGPGICKDKLMQAAGRLRQLGRGRQMLRVVGVPDVTAKILAAPDGGGAEAEAAGQQGKGQQQGQAQGQEQRQQEHTREQGQRQQQGQQEPGMAAVLRWVMDNTVEALLRGVPEWAAKGLHFATTAGCPSRALQQEEQQLQQLYGGSKARQPVHAVVEAMASEHLERLEGSQAPPGQEDLAAARALAARVCQLSARYGQGQSLVAGVGADEECERELEAEEEQEQEQEVQLPAVEPAAECDWAYSRALAAATAAELARAGGPELVPLAQAARLLAPESVGQLPWSGRVFCTSNCLHTTRCGAVAGATSQLNNYLRPLDTVLLLPSGEAVLLSEREVDGLLELVWGASGGGNDSWSFGSSAATSQGPGPLLLSLPYARLPRAAGAWPPLTVALRPQQAGPSLADAELVSMQLFNGGASYPGEGQLQQLAELVRGRREAAEALVAMRGLLPLFPRSDLEKACDCRLGQA
jgi:hypothetical protein